MSDTVAGSLWTGMSIVNTMIFLHACKQKPTPEMSIHMKSQQADTARQLKETEEAKASLAHSESTWLGARDGWGREPQ